MQTIAIIGAGVTGLSCAVRLLRAGFKVSIFDRSGFPGQGASAAAAGMLTPLGESAELPLRFVEAGLKAIGIWKDLLADEMPCALKRRGSLLVASAFDRPLLTAFRRGIEPLSDRWVMLDTAGVRTLEPCLSPVYEDGLYFPEDAHLDAIEALKAMVRLTLQMGGQLICEETEVSDLWDRYDRVIDCRGWTQDHDPDLHAVKGEALSLLPPDGFQLTRPVRFFSGAELFYAVPHAGDGLIVGATMRREALPVEDMPRLDGLKSLLDAAQTLDRRLNRAYLKEVLCGVRPSYPTKLPRISTGQDGAYIAANGMYRHGFLLGPVVAQAVMDLVNSDDTPCLSMFSDRNNDRGAL